ncbi:hypothetical protein [Spirillospora sp. NPDC048823]|uniref:hypothetical protein n=1 Tax=unclassified Spirillospora TaxID=2642701 RepID=UPI003716166E
MDATVVALIGTGATLIGTLGGAFVGPWLAERMRRKSSRMEQTYAQQLALYGDLLRVTAQLVDNARNRASTPLADLPEPSDEELDRLISQARVLASDDVEKHLDDLSRLIHKIHRMLVMDIVPYHQKLHDEGKSDDGAAIQKRVALAGPVDELVAVYDRFRASIRNEMKP